jgi:hypothetical protein
MTTASFRRVAIVQLSLSALTMFGWSAQAAADDARPAKPAVAASDPKATAAATDPPAGDAAAAPTSTAAIATPEAPPADRYPRAVIQRPLTLPAGVAMLGSDFTANHDVSTMGAAPVLGFGITDDLEIQIPYAFATKDFEAKGSLNFDVGYKLLRGAMDGKLEVIARARTGYDFLNKSANPLMLGVHVQYNITDNFAVISGFPSTQQLSIALDDGGVMGAPKPVTFNVPVSFGYQVHPLVYLQLDTKLAQFKISDADNAFIFADTTPVALTVVYNVLHAVDVQAAIGTDLSNDPGNTVAFLVGARYYAGKL